MQLDEIIGHLGLDW